MLRLRGIPLTRNPRMRGFRPLPGKRGEVNSQPGEDDLALMLIDWQRGSDLVKKIAIAIERRRTTSGRLRQPRKVQLSETSLRKLAHILPHSHSGGRTTRDAFRSAPLFAM
jgi:hypothetical protein